MEAGVSTVSATAASMKMKNGVTASNYQKHIVDRVHTISREPLPIALLEKLLNV
jgi:hypothetical protein